MCLTVGRPAAAAAAAVCAVPAAQAAVALVAMVQEEEETDGTSAKGNEMNNEECAGEEIWRMKFQGKCEQLQWNS